MLFNAIRKFKKLENNVKFMLRHLTVVFVFTILYFLSEKLLIYEGEKDKIKEPMTLLDCFYFSLVTQTTVGYGRIYPINTYSRIINIFQLLSIYGVFVIEI